MHWPGIEPGPPAWQARILPLNHQCSDDKTSEITQYKEALNFITSLCLTQDNFRHQESFALMG